MFQAPSVLRSKLKRAKERESLKNPEEADLRQKDDDEGEEAISPNLDLEKQPYERQKVVMISLDQDSPYC